MTDLIPFPRLGHAVLQDPQSMADLYQTISHVGWYRNPPNRCANGMPGHPPCRSPAELERLLRASADTTAAKEGV